MLSKLSFGYLFPSLSVKKCNTPNFVLEKPFYIQKMRQKASESIYSFSPSRPQCLRSRVRCSPIVLAMACDKSSSLYLFVPFFPSFAIFSNSLHLVNLGYSLALLLDYYLIFHRNESKYSLKLCNDRVSSQPQT